MGDAVVKAPRFEWTWNLNTIVVLVGFGSGIFAWGYSWRSVDNLAIAVEKIDVRVTALEVTPRRLDSIEFRVRANEIAKEKSDRSFELILDRLNTFGADLRVTREILERIENSRTNLRFTPAPKLQRDALKVPEELLVR